MVVVSATPGPLKVLIVDVTGNSRGFEHAVSQRITEELVHVGVSVTATSPVLITSEQEFADCFGSAGEFSVLLLVAHGSRDRRDEHATWVGGPGEVREWFSMAALSEKLQDKILLLCVCSGFTRDAIDAFARDTSEVLSVVAPETLLSAQEAVNFFPRFLQELRSYELSEFDPVNLKRALDHTNVHAHGTMKIFSDALRQR